MWQHCFRYDSGMARVWPRWYQALGNIHRIHHGRLVECPWVSSSFRPSPSGSSDYCVQCTSVGRDRSQSRQWPRQDQPTLLCLDPAWQYCGEYHCRRCGGGRSAAVCHSKLLRQCHTDDDVERATSCKISRPDILSAPHRVHNSTGNLSGHACQLW